jgi:hypothetical protein
VYERHVISLVKQQGRIVEDRNRQQHRNGSVVRFYLWKEWNTHTVVDDSSTQVLTNPFSSSHNTRSLPPRIEPLVLPLSYVFFLPILKRLDNNPATMGSNGWGPMERHKVYSVVGRNTDNSQTDVPTIRVPWSMGHVPMVHGYDRYGDTTPLRTPSETTNVLQTHVGFE